MHARFNTLRIAKIATVSMIFGVAQPQSLFNDSGVIFNTSSPNTFSDNSLNTQPAGDLSNPQANAQAMIAPSMTSETETNSDSYLISVDFRDTPLSDVLRTLADASGLNLVISPNIQSQTPVSMKLDNITYKAALETVIRNYNLDAQISGNILRLDSLDRVANELNMRQNIQNTEWNSQPTRILVWQLNYADASSVSAIVSSMVKSRFSNLKQFAISVDERSNKIIIESIPDVLERAKALLKTLDVRKKQVLIEARIIEASRELSRTLGVSWGARFGLDAQRGLSSGWVFPNSVVGSIGGAGSVGQVQPQPGVAFGPNQAGTTALTIGSINNVFNLDAVIRAYESENMANVIASPRIVVEDQDSATIGEQTSARRETIADGVVTSTTSEFGLTLDVTPKITSDGNVQMKIEVNRGIPTGAASATGAESITNRSAKTNLSVADGETAVIGGLYTASKVETAGKLPILGDIPILGWLFRNKQKQLLRNELMVLITPRVIKHSGQGYLGSTASTPTESDYLSMSPSNQNNFSNFPNNNSNFMNNESSGNENTGNSFSSNNNEDLSNELNDGFNNGANNSFNNGANNSFNNGANNSFNNGANNSFNNGANNSFNNGANNSFNNGFNNGVNSNF